MKKNLSDIVSWLKKWSYTVKKRWYIVIISVIILIVVSSISIFFRGNNNEPVRIGVLHSLTGTMAASEAPLIDVIQLATEEINAAGGFNGRKFELVIADCRSDALYCAREAERLITSEKVSVLFGCWTSACRKEVKTVVEKYHHLLFYAIQYEGLEESPNIIYTGSTPNQQVIPMALWALQNKGKRFYLIGSDYVFPRTANAMIKDVLLAQGAILLGERYVKLEESNMKELVNEMAATRPDFVINTLNGKSNSYFFQALRNANITAARIPVFSSSIAEDEINVIVTDHGNLTEGHYAAWSYFQSLQTDQNKSFIKDFQVRFGKNRVVSDPILSTYLGVKLWAASVIEQNSVDIEYIKPALAHQTMLSPAGIVAVDYETMHLWKNIFIGKIRADGQFEIVWKSHQPIRPVPFPFYRTRFEWNEFQKNMAVTIP